MKKYTVLPFFIILIMIAASSCQKGILDKVPQDQVAVETFWENEQQARLALNGCYSVIDGFAYGAWYYDAYADNAFAQYPWESSATTASSGEFTSTTDFGYNYEGIRRANTLLDNINKVPMNETLKKRYIAEARFLRAMNYLDLAQNFGPVPLLTTINYDKTKLAPVPEKDVVTFILKELSEAATDLPLSYPGGVSTSGGGQETGRVTKGAALALKARTELFYSIWNDAATTAKQVMDLNQYSLFKVNSLTADDLVDDYSPFINFTSDQDKTDFYKGLASYQQLFWEGNEATNKEFILVSQYIPNSPYERSSGVYTLLMPNELSGWSSITPTISLVNSYWNKDGSVFTPPSMAERATNYNSGTPSAKFFDEFKNRDTRLYATIMFESNPWNKIENGYKYSWPRTGSNTSRTGFNFRKLVDPNYKDEWSAPQDFPLIRYAEILLTYAEAKNEAAGPSADVYDALDMIRDRVAMPRITRNQSQASLRNIIRNERRIELVLEGLRNADIKRWGIAPQVMKDEYSIMNTLVQKRTWSNKMMRYPYPQPAVDNNPLLKEAQTAKGY